MRIFQQKKRKKNGIKHRYLDELYSVIKEPGLML